MKYQQNNPSMFWFVVENGTNEIRGQATNYEEACRLMSRLQRIDAQHEVYFEYEILKAADLEDLEKEIY